MLIHLTNFRGLPIASSHEEAKIGEIEEAVIHPETGEVIGFWVKTPGFFGKHLALSARDITAYDLNGVVVENAESLVDPAEIQPFKKFSRQPNQWIGKTVVSENKENLGKVEDVVIETDLDIITKIYVGGLLKPKRIIARDQIIKVDNKKITVSGIVTNKIKEMALKEA